MKNKTVNFWNIENEHVKNLIFFFTIILISLIAILASSILVGLVNTVRFLITHPEMENLRDTVTNLINTSNAWSFINEVLRGILIIALIKSISRIFSKSKISLKELGFHIDVKQSFYMLIGFTLMSAMFLLSLFINTGSDSVLNSLGITFSQKSIVLLMLIAIANAFWQEIVFRGYLQKRLIDTYGILTGIVICAFLFTIIHGLAREINFIEIILGTVLFTLIGVVFYLTNSIIFATAIHAAGNFFLRSFATNNLYIPEQEYRLVVYSIVLIIILIVNKNKLLLSNQPKENNSKYRVKT